MLPTITRNHGGRDSGPETSLIRSYTAVPLLCAAAAAAAAAVNPLHLKPGDNCRWGIGAL